MRDKLLHSIISFQIKYGCRFENETMNFVLDTELPSKADRPVIKSEVRLRKSDCYCRMTTTNS